MDATTGLDTFLGKQKAPEPFCRHCAGFECRNTRPTSVLSLAGDTEQRMSCATFALRLPPRQRSSPRARLLMVLVPKVLPRCRPIMSRLPTTVGNPVMSHYRMVLDRHMVT